MRETGCKITKKNRNEEHFFLPFLFLKLNIPQIILIFSNIQIAFFLFFLLNNLNCNVYCLAFSLSFCRFPTK